MIVNIYLDNSRFLTSQVDEDTTHLLGDSIIHNGQRYIIVNIIEEEHIDYQTIVRINELSEKSPDNELDEVINIEV